MRLFFIDLSWDTTAYVKEGYYNLLSNENISHLKTLSNEHYGMDLNWQYPRFS